MAPVECCFLRPSVHDDRQCRPISPFRPQKGFSPSPCLWDTHCSTGRLEPICTVCEQNCCWELRRETCEDEILDVSGFQCAGVDSPRYCQALTRQELAREKKDGVVVQLQARAVKLCPCNVAGVGEDACAHEGQLFKSASIKTGRPSSL